MTRRLLPVTLIGLCLAAAYGWAELKGFVWTDYEASYLVPLQHLVAHDWRGFFTSPAMEGPSLLLRAPFALSVNLWGGGDVAVYRMMMVPGLLAGVLLGTVLFELRHRLHPGARWPLLFALLAAANPLTLRMLELAHGEELLGAALAVGAVLAALGGRPWLAAVLLGLACANKAWAVLAIGPVLLALDRRRLPVLLLAGAIAVAFVVPFMVASPESRAALGSTGHTYAIFQPWQVWWFLGDHGHVVRGTDGMVKEGFRAAPAWIATFTHPLIASLVVPFSLAFWRRRGTGHPDVLLLLALLLLARCALDVADTGYYHLPFVLALLAWETVRSARPPVLTLGACGLVWLTLDKLPQTATPDAQSLAYVAFALPALVALSVATFRRPRPRRGAEPSPVALAPAVA